MGLEVEGQERPPDHPVPSKPQDEEFAKGLAVGLVAPAAGVIAGPDFDQ